MPPKNPALAALLRDAPVHDFAIVGFITDARNVSQGLIPAKTMLASLILSFAALTPMVFLFVFQKSQS